MEKYKFVTYQKGEDLPEKYLLSAANLYCQIWQEAPWLEEWQEEAAASKFTDLLLKEGAWLTLCLFDDQVAGFTGGRLIDRNELEERGGKALARLSNGKTVYYVVEMGISGQHRGQGLGQKLLTDLINHANSKYPSPTILLHTDNDAKNAHRLYQKCGFHQTNIADLRVDNHTYWAR